MKRATTAFLAVTAVVHVLLAAWVRRDADSRDADARPWDVLTLFTGVVGLLGYLRARAGE